MWSEGSAAQVIELGEEGVSYARTDDGLAMVRRFGVTSIIDPRCSMSADLISRCALFRPAWCFTRRSYPESHFRMGVFLAGKSKSASELMAEKLRDQTREEEELGLIDYRFNLSVPISPQIETARTYLLSLQEEAYGKRNTRRPSQEIWPTYLRVLDARDCGASWQKLGKTLWPDYNGEAKDRARTTYGQAKAVRDNFPL
ncbi:hypothetical protein AUC69_03460 [Methyloceanibacter superfactus]|uniref:Uncharacterized protein n=1 Tax=Methyloceanibacter superfactus TaxID=1774969 RepID=A0A1E3VL09_9HYPH|nr:hypothetical protein AUC69_03460 [Methyloceanibacter superfactus]